MNTQTLATNSKSEYLKLSPEITNKKSKKPKKPSKKLTQTLENQLNIKIDINKRLIFCAQGRIHLNLLAFAKDYSFAIQLEIE